MTQTNKQQSEWNTHPPGLNCEPLCVHYTVHSHHHHHHHHWGTLGTRETERGKFMASYIPACRMLNSRLPCPFWGFRQWWVLYLSYMCLVLWRREAGTDYRTFLLWILAMASSSCYSGSASTRFLIAHSCGGTNVTFSQCLRIPGLPVTGNCMDLSVFFNPVLFSECPAFLNSFRL